MIFFTDRQHFLACNLSDFSCGQGAVKFSLLDYDSDGGGGGDRNYQRTQPPGRLRGARCRSINFTQRHADLLFA